MFRVRDKRNGTVRTVYAINGLLFLFFADGCWCWDAIDLYEPVED